MGSTKVSRTTVLAGVLALAASSPLPAPAQERPPEPPPGLGNTAKDFFKGKVISFKGRRIEILYDFADRSQGDDWMFTYPFLAPATTGGWRVEGGVLRGDGNAGFRHRAVFDNELKVAATVASEDARNFGLLALDADHSQFTLFGLGDTHFALLDNKNPLRHMILTFLPAGGGRGGSTEWRDIHISYEPRIGGEPMEVRVRKRGPANEFRFGAGGILHGVDKETKVGPKLQAAFYTLGSRVTVRRCTLSGVLDESWLKTQGIPFEGATPEDPEPLEGEKPAAGGAGAPGPAPGPGPVPPRSDGSDWQSLAWRVADSRQPREAREKAADALIAAKERPALRSMIDLMYGDDAPGREIAARVFKAVSGKETGYRHEAPRDARLKAMPAVWAVWYQVKDALDREEREKKGKEK